MRLRFLEGKRSDKDKEKGLRKRCRRKEKKNKRLTKKSCQIWKFFSINSMKIHNLLRFEDITIQCFTEIDSDNILTFVVFRQ